MAGLPPALASKAAQAQATTSAAAPANGVVKPTFAWTDADIQAAVDDLMAGLPAPKAIQSTGRRSTFAVIGPKGGKTIASIAVKTDKCPGLPRPEGSIVVVIHMDNQAPNSWENFLFMAKATVAPGHEPHFIGLGEAKGRYLSRVRRSVPAYSAYVKEVIVALLVRLGERGDVGMTVLDGYGDICTQYGGYVAAHANGLDSPLSLEGTQWFPRREMFSDILLNGRNSVIPGGAFIINGPEGGLDQDRETKGNKDATKVAQVAKRIKREGLVGREPPAKWFLYRENNENVDSTITTSVDFTGVGEPVYSAKVWEGRHGALGIYTGRELDITGRSIGAFADPALAKESP